MKSLCEKTAGMIIKYFYCFLFFIRRKSKYKIVSVLWQTLIKTVKCENRQLFQINHRGIKRLFLAETFSKKKLDSRFVSPKFSLAIFNCFHVKRARSSRCILVLTLSMTLSQHSTFSLCSWCSSLRKADRGHLPTKVHYFFGLVTSKTSW